MNDLGLKAVTAPVAKEICGRFQISDEAKVLLQENATPRQYLNVLVEKELFIDAVKFLAYALPKREAVWWACACVRAVTPDNASEKIMNAIQAAETWVRGPTEENRRASMPAAEAAELGTPAGCAAAAAFWSGGSLAPPDQPVVPPAEHLTAHGVVGAVMLAAVSTKPEKAPEKNRMFISLGIEVANGINQWKKLD